MLNLPGAKNIFPHARDFDQGLGRIRPGQADIVVATDGSGDCDTPAEAIKILPSAGGVVYVKEGTYDLMEEIVLTDNILLTGAGKSTVFNVMDGHDTATCISITGNGSRVTNIYIKQDASADDKKGVSITGHWNYVEGCWFNLLEDNAVELWTNSYGNHVLNNSIVSRNNAINLSNTYGNFVVGNYIELTTGHTAIRLVDNADFNLISGNYVKETVGAVGTAGITIVDNTSDRNIVLGNHLYQTDTPYTDNGTNTDAGHNIIV